MRTVLPIAGAIVGTFFGQPQLGYAIGALIGNAVDPLVVEGPRIGDAARQTAREGVPRAIIYGVGLVGSNCVAAGPLRKVYREESQGKGGQPSVDTEYLYMTGAFMFGEPVAGILSIKENGTKVYDVGPGSTMLAESAVYASKNNMRFYDGSETQLPDPDLEALFGVGSTAYHRGSSYVVFGNRDITKFGGVFPQMEFELASAGTLNPANTVAMINSGVSIGVGGGTGLAGWCSVHYWDNVPLEAFNGLLARANVSNPLLQEPVRIICYATEGGQQLFNSGWMGNTADNLALQLALDNITFLRYSQATGPAIQDYTTDEEIRPRVLSWGGGTILGTDDVPAYYAPSGAPGTMRVEIIQPMIGKPANSSSGQLTLTYPDVSEPYVALPELPGALRGLETGETYFTPYATGVGTIDADSVLLSDIVTDICARAGLPADRIDVSELTDVVQGFVLANNYAAREAIDALRPCYFFDYCCVDGVLRFVKRGGAVKGVITDDDLVEDFDDLMREQAAESPRALHMSYQYRWNNYAPIKATSQRESEDVLVTGEQAFVTPVVFGDVDEPSQIVDKQHKVMETDAQGELNFVLGMDFLELTVTDAWAFQVRGKNRRIRVTQVDYADGALRVKARIDRQSAVTSNVTGLPPPAVRPPPSALSGPTVFGLLNCCGYRDADDRLGVYLFAAGVLPSWAGCLVQLSVNDGASYEDLAIIRTPARMGYLRAALPAGSEYFADYTSTLPVTMYDDRTLDSITREELLSELNGGVVFDGAGGGELLQWQDATGTGDPREYDLTTLLRGRLNSGAAAHSSSSTFAVLSSGVFAELPIAQIGRALKFRVVNLDSTPELAPVYDFTFSPAASQTEFAPSLSAVVRTGADHITGRVDPRHRFGTDINPVPSTNYQGIELEFDDGTNPPIRYNPAIPGALGPDYAFDVDVSGLLSPVTLRAYQRNRLTGLGPSNEVII